MEDNKKAPGDAIDASKYMMSGRQMGKSFIDEMIMSPKMLDKYRKLLEGYEFMSDNRNEKVDKLKNKRKELQGYLDKIDRCIEQAGKLQFKEGNVIFSKEHGPVVVSEIVVDIEDPSYMPDPSAKEPFKFFYKGYAKGGQVAIKAEDALPYNETTKLLYEKNKP